MGCELGFMRMVSILKNYHYNGQDDDWWLRSPYDAGDVGTIFAWYVDDDGSVYHNYDLVDRTFCGRRPAFVLPSSLFVSDDGDVGSDSNGGVSWDFCGNMIYSK